MIPGDNTLEIALSVLGSTSVNYFQFLNRSPNTAGIDVTNYNTFVTFPNGSFQPIKRQNYFRMGLDFTKRYANWYISGVDAIDLARDVSGDVVEALGRRWQLIGSQDWYIIDGWKSLMAVDIGPATGALTNA